MGVRIGTLVSMSDPLFSRLYMCALNVVAAAYTPFVLTPPCNVSAVTAVGNSTFRVQSCCWRHSTPELFPKKILNSSSTFSMENFLHISSNNLLFLRLRFFFERTIMVSPRTNMKIRLFLTSKSQKGFRGVWECKGHGFVKLQCQRVSNGRDKKHFGHKSRSGTENVMG